MFHTVISADLPSEVVAGSAPQDDGHSTRHERVTYSTSRLLRTLQQVFEQADMRDLAFLEIDGQTAYVDTTEADAQDLALIVSASQDGGFLDREFNLLVCGIVHWEEGIQHIVETRVRTAVPEGEHEMVVTIVSRPDDLNCRRLDDAERYSSRLREVYADVDRISAMREATERVAGRIDAALRRTLFRRTVIAGRTMLRVVRPRLADLKAMERCTFGPTIVPPAYRVLPSDAPTEPQWFDHGLRVFEDPFFVFRHWVTLDALMNLAMLRLEWVQVVEPDGRVLFEGHKARWFENWPGAQKFSVQFVPEAGVKVIVRS